MWLCVGLLTGFFLLQQLAVLPDVQWLVATIVVTTMALLKGIWRYIMLFMLGVCLAMGYGTYHAKQRLADYLSEQHEGEVSPVVVRVQQLAIYRDNTIQFDVEVLDRGSIKEGIPSSLRVFWSFGDSFSLYKKVRFQHMPEVRPGQVWEMSLKLSRPNSLLNPGGFDNESYLFRENIRAIGSVIGTPILKEQEQHTLQSYIQAWRHDLRKNLHTYWGDKRYGAVLIALVIGDQQGISTQDWLLFNRSGMTHLVSISGSHITMLSGLVTLLSLWGLKRCSWQGSPLSNRCDISAWAYGFGIVIALLYCLLAGWGIPAQRTFLMLLLGYIFYLLQRPLSLYQLFIITAIIVLVLDPWAILSTGFYLSFAAVAVLHILLNRLRQRQRYPTQEHRALYWQMLKDWAIVQGVITLALTPFLMYFFNQISLISPIVNAYAVVSVGLIITPMALLFALLSAFFEPNTCLHYLALVNHQLLSWVMELTQYLAQLPWASLEVSIVPMWVRLLCGFGILILLLPRGLPYRYLALVFVVPIFFSSQHHLREGEWQALFFDIGQAGAVLLKTKNHILLFDTGVRRSADDDSGGKVILPTLRALGIKSIDTLVVSHADIDHSGGLATLIQSIWVKKAYASFQLDHFLDREEWLLDQKIESLNPLLSYKRCAEGQTFVIDNIKFRFLNPVIGNIPSKSTNHQSCVLAVEGKYHRLLLTGDILVEQEQQLYQSTAFLPPYQIVQVPHHGSKSSSSQEFIYAVQADYAIAQTAYQNRFKHPHPQIKERWQQQRTVFLNTAETGAVEISSTMLNLQVHLFREQERRYWHR